MARSPRPPPQPPWLVTREPAAGASLVAALRARGVTAVGLPAIERKALPWPERFADAARPGTWVLCTSAFAVRVFVEAMGERARGLRYAAIAPATVAELEAHGLAAEVVAPGGVVALTGAVVEACPPGVLLYPTSRAGLDESEQAAARERLRAAGFSLHCEAIYETLPASGLAAALRPWLADPWRVVLFSPSAARAVAEALAALGGRPPTDCVCVGDSTARAWPLRSTVAPRDVDLAVHLAAREEPT